MRAKTSLCLMLSTLVFASGSLLAQTRGLEPTQKIPAAKKDASIYTVSTYDPERDAAKDLAATVKRAKAENKSIILEIGGDW